jgi:hypothetical protein
MQIQEQGQGEARHGKYKRLKLDGGQAYDCSADYSFRVVAAQACIYRKPLHTL